MADAIGRTSQMEFMQRMGASGYPDIDLAAGEAGATHPDGVNDK